MVDLTVQVIMPYYYIKCNVLLNVLTLILHESIHRSQAMCFIEKKYVLREEIAPRMIIHGVDRNRKFFP